MDGEKEEGNEWRVSVEKCVKGPGCKDSKED